MPPSSLDQARPDTQQNLETYQSDDQPPFLFAGADSDSNLEDQEETNNRGVSIQSDEDITIQHPV
jgi:hypothetical protein